MAARSGLPAAVTDALPAEALEELQTKLKPMLDGLPPQAQMHIFQQTASLAVQFSSPIPPGPVLQGINSVIPDGAERVLRMTEKDQDHAHRMDRRQIDYPFIYQFAGLVLGALVAVSGLVGAVYCIVNNHPTAGGVIFTGTLVSIVGILVRGAWAQKPKAGAQPVRSQGTKQQQKRKGK